jgi:hypothetical protein
MPYYPKSRYISKIADKNKFLLPDGNEYIGPYYITYSGDYITGENPLSLDQRILTPIIEDNTKNLNYENNIFKKLNSSLIIDELIDPEHYIPVPQDEDYKLGKITRYFAKERKRNIINIREINKEAYIDIREQNGIYNYAKWDITSLLWQISGPLNNELKEGNIVRVGIIDTNKRIIESKNKKFIGLKEYLTDLSKFSKK